MATYINKPTISKKTDKQIGTLVIVTKLTNLEVYTLASELALSDHSQLCFELSEIDTYITSYFQPTNTNDVSFVFEVYLDKYFKDISCEEDKVRLDKYVAETTDVIKKILSNGKDN